MKTKSLIPTLCVILIPILVSCYEESPFWIHLSSDDLSYLIFDKDTCTFYDNTSFSYNDTAYYLQNDKDTLRIGVSTLTHTWANAILVNRAGGETHYGNTDNCRYTMSVAIERDDDTLKLHKTFGVCYKSDNTIPVYYTCFQYDTWNPDSTVIIDTAKVLGKTYTDVIKFIDYALPFYTKIYFAKNYGYIYIEQVDGENLKLIGYKKGR